MAILAPELVGQIAVRALVSALMCGRQVEGPVTSKKENMTSIRRAGQLSLTIFRISQHRQQYDAVLETKIEREWIKAKDGGKYLKQDELSPISDSFRMSF